MNRQISDNFFKHFRNHFFACGLNQFIHIQKNVACNHCSNACIRYRVYQAKQNLLYRSYSVYMLFFLCLVFVVVRLFSRHYFHLNSTLLLDNNLHVYRGMRDWTDASTTYVDDYYVYSVDCRFWMKSSGDGSSFIRRLFLSFLCLEKKGKQKRYHICDLIWTLFANIPYPLPQKCAMIM